MSSPEHDVRLDHDSLLIGDVRVSFQRTLRIPERGVHALPPGLGEFPLRRVADYPDTAPSAWLKKGGVMLPVYQREAMWLSFSSEAPAALKVGTGKVCAVSGAPWSDSLSQDPQDYLAVPLQPWLDGINSGDGTVRQFVAVRHGLGATVEGQVTGEETHGGVQLAAHGLTAEARQRWEAEQKSYAMMDFMAAPVACASMGIGAGGTMRQEIYDDDRPLSDYQPQGSRVFVHLCSATQWRQITGEEPPVTPVSARAYTQAGLPWFDYYDADAADLPPSQALADVKPVGDWLGEDPDLEGLQQPTWVVPVGPDTNGAPVVDGDWYLRGSGKAHAGGLNAAAQRGQVGGTDACLWRTHSNPPLFVTRARSTGPPTVDCPWMSWRSDAGPTSASASRSVSAMGRLSTMSSIGDSQC